MSSSSDNSLEAQPAAPADRRVGQVYLLWLVTLCLAVLLGQRTILVDTCFALAVTEALFILLAVVYVRAKRLPMAESLAWRPVSLPDALAGAILGVTGLGAAQAIGLLLEPIIGPGPPLDFLRAGSPGRLVALLLCGAVLPGVCEETLFRGAIQGTLSRLGPTKAILITTILFTLIHVDPWSMIPIFLLGLMLGILAWRTGSIFPSMIAHAASNATAFLLLYWFPNEHDRGAQTVEAILTVAFVVAFPVFLSRSRRRLATLGPLAYVRAALSWRAVGISLALIAGALLLSNPTAIVKRLRELTGF